ncbi:MAG TPA: hypothetical protein VFT47_17900, partial [Vicinamibacterales bacterium]|nr:hypothetical protein [Vicinamibacterales bacterium]
NSDPDGIFDRELFRGEPDPVSSARHVVYWNEKFRATLWGHMTLLNLRRLVEPINSSTRAFTFSTPASASRPGAVSEGAAARLALSSTATLFTGANISASRPVRRVSARR